jgi:ABC-type Fe3+/spermidine/putrescine transport system ATPase subunit
MPTNLQVKNLTKRFGKVVAVNDVSFSVETGDYLTLLGPSGCGKTTTLRCIAGLERIDAGEILILGETMSSSRFFVPPEKRNVGMVFQSYAIWPHMTVYGNIAYGLRIKKYPKKEIKEKVRSALNMVGLDGLENRYATQLSGGQQQRVALARSLALEPKILLFDEPLSNLDAKLRERMRFELRSLQKKLRITSVYVTHDQAEAMVISDKIILMKDGRIVQEGNPRELYEKPADKFVADFIGLTNFLRGTVRKKPNGSEFGIVEMNNGFAVHCQLPTDLAEGSQVEMAIRPFNVLLVAEKDAKGKLNCWKGKILKAVYLGEHQDFYISIGDDVVRAQVNPRMPFEEGDDVYIQVEPHDVLVFQN